MSLIRETEECEDFASCNEPKKARQTFSAKEGGIKTVYTCSKCDKILFRPEVLASRPDWVNPNE